MEYLHVTADAANAHFNSHQRTIKPDAKSSYSQKQPTSIFLNGASMKQRIVIDLNDKQPPSETVAHVLELLKEGQIGAVGSGWCIERIDQPEFLYVFYECINGIVSEVLTTKIKSKADKWVNAFLRENNWKSVEDYENNPIIGLEYELFETVIR